MAYSQAHYRRLSNGTIDTEAAGRARVIARRAAELAHAEALARFGSITGENARAVLAYQEERAAFHAAWLQEVS